MPAINAARVRKAVTAPSFWVGGSLAAMLSILATMVWWFTPHEQRTASPDIFDTGGVNASLIRH
jgi:hypothetical protein